MTHVAAWVALLAMWLGAGLTDLLLDRGTAHLPAEVVYWNRAFGRR